MYKIHTEGRSLSEAVKEGRTVRVDLKNEVVRNINEFKNWNYEVKVGHKNGDLKIAYVTIISKKEVAKPNKKKTFVLKNANQLGIDSGYVNNKGEFAPTWYIIDKNTGDIVDSDEGEGARTRLKKLADSWNR